MKDKQIVIKKFGLVGRNIEHSFSKRYFSEKFRDQNLENHFYYNFDIPLIDSLLIVLDENPELKGLNVTIPYKEEVLSYLDKISKNAKKIGAVNAVKISKKGMLTGYNTDFYGFKKSIKPLLKRHHKKALILGTGGASKAVAYALKNLKIEYDFVSRIPSEYELNYTELNKEAFNEYQIIINTTPLGTSPNIQECPPIPYSYFTSDHIAYDLIYNPEETSFLAQAKAKGAVIKNGMDMLVLQAEKSWKIWNKKF